MPLVHYNAGEPTETGVYAVRIEDPLEPSPPDRFLLWAENKWWWLGSDQRCRYPVLGWIGPLARKLEKPT